METARARSMQMREYIYLGTTPMYFLGASGRIVGSESNTHTLATLRYPHRSAKHKQARTHARGPLCACERVRVCHRSDTPEIYEQTSSLPRANRPASYGPIQFNFENKQPPLATSVNLFRVSRRARCLRTQAAPFRVDLGKFLAGPLRRSPGANVDLSSVGDPRKPLCAKFRPNPRRSMDFSLIEASAGTTLREYRSANLHRDANLIISGICRADGI